MTPNSSSVHPRVPAAAPVSSDAGVADPEYVLTLSCPDVPGIVYAVSSFLVQHHCSIETSQQFGDGDSGLFFMRVRFACAEAAVSLEQATATDFGADIGHFLDVVEPALRSAKTACSLMVSKFGHCLNDLLFRYSIGALPIGDRRRSCRITATSSRSPRRTTSPFTTFPSPPTPSRRQKPQLLELVDDLRIDLVVLARYMQVLSTDLCKQLEGRAINIHHSFLPSFKGGEAVPPGPRTRREADRCHRPLRDLRSRRRSDHRTGGRARRPFAEPLRARRRRSRRGVPGTRACGSLAHRESRAAERPPHRRLSLGQRQRPQAQDDQNMTKGPQP